MIKIGNLDITTIYIGSTNCSAAYVGEYKIYGGEPEPVVPSNEIWYWTTDGLTAQTTNTTGITSLNTMGLVSNEVVGDKCIMTFSKDVTSINNNAFYGCDTITKYKLPQCTTTIMQASFYKCSGLTEINDLEQIESIGNSAFTYCNSVETLVLPNNLKSSIENSTGTFGYMTGLTSVTLPTNITTIKNRTFQNCTSLVEIVCMTETAPTLAATNCFSTFPMDGVIKCWEGVDFNSWFTTITRFETNNWTFERIPLPEDLPTVKVTMVDGSVEYNRFLSRNIPDAYYQSNSNIQSVEIGDGITSIGASAFSSCSSLTSIEIPNSVTSIGGYAFYECSSLTSITVDPSNTVYHSDGNCCMKDGEVVFGCKTSVIPTTATSIGAGAFSTCSGLTSITIPDSVTSIGSYAFQGCTSLSSITLPNGVTMIGYYQFNRCLSLTSVTIPDSVTSIDNSAFQYCSSLTSITIPNSVTSIGAYAFRGCSSLTSVTIGDSVTSIYSYAFNNVPTEGVLYCDEDWFNNLSDTNKTNLGNVANWTRNPISA